MSCICMSHDSGGRIVPQNAGNAFSRHVQPVVQVFVVGEYLLDLGVCQNQTVAKDTTPDWVTSRVMLVSDRGTRIELHHVSADRSRDNTRRAPVLLAHGTFSNHRTCGGLARYLARLGHDCWLINNEGHGGSDSIFPSADFDSLFLSGTRAAVRHTMPGTGALIGLCKGLGLPELSRLPSTRCRCIECANSCERRCRPGQSCQSLTVR